METSAPPSTPPRWHRMLALIISPFAFLLALWSLVHTHAVQHSLTNQTNALTTLFKREIPALQVQVERHEQQLQALNAIPASDTARVHADVAQLVEQSQLTWEVTGNPVQTARFLNLALGKLTPYQDTTSTALKATLQQDLQTLNSLNSVSPERVIASLETLITQINAIALVPSTYQPTAGTDTNPPLTAHPWLSRLQGLVTIRKTSPPATAAGSLQAREQARQNLLVKLALSQWAVAQHQPALYLQNMQAAHRLWQQLTIPAATGAPIEQQFLELLAAPLQPTLQLQSWEKHA